MINLLVSGGRDYPDRARVFAVLDVVNEHNPVAEVRHGACGADLRSVPTGTCDACYQALIQVCGHVQDPYYNRVLRGADRWADEWARERGISVRRCPSDWSGQGRAAGMRRNGTMLVEEPPVDLVVCFPGGPGTAGMARLAATAGVPVLDLAAEEPLPAKVCVRQPACAGCGKTMFVLGDTRELCASCLAKEAPRRVPDMALRAEMAKIAEADAREIRGWAGKDMTDLHRLAALGRLVPAGTRSDGTPWMAPTTQSPGRGTWPAGTTWRNDGQ